MSNSHSWSLALHSSVSVIWNGGFVGAAGVSGLAGKPHGARLSSVMGAHISASWAGYGHDLGRQPNSRRHVLERNSNLSCLVMYSAWMLFLV